MTYEELYKMVEQGEFDPGVLYATARNNPYLNERWRADRIRKEDAFRDCCRGLATSELGQIITPQQFSAVYNLAWEEGHAHGYLEVLNKFGELLEVVKQFVTPVG